MINPTSKLIQISNYTELERVEGVINESFSMIKLPTTVGQTNFINNNRSVCGLHILHDTLGNIYVTGGFYNKQPHHQIFSNNVLTFNEIVYQYNVASNTWISLPNNPPMILRYILFLIYRCCLGILTCIKFIPSFSTTNVANNIQAFEYYLYLFLDQFRCN